MALLPNFNLDWLKPAILRRNDTRKLRTLEGPSGANKYYDAFLNYLGFGFTTYPAEGPTYVDQGYNANGDVYAVINQIATKGSSVPFCIKEIKDKPKARRVEYQKKSLLAGDTRSQIQLKQMMHQAYEETELPLPIDRPNPMQTWNEWMALYYTFLNLTGNAYIYMAMPEEGRNAGKPIMLFLLPSHLIQIVVKQDYRMLGDEISPIDHYTLINGDRYHDFQEEEVIHINFPNPNYNLNGSQLYGQSPLRSVLTEIQASNEGNMNNLRTQRSGGAIGLLYGKGATLEKEQAEQLKQRLVQMRNDATALAQIAPISTEVGFIPITLDNQKLQPFEAQKYAQKKIANALNWSDKLLNNDAGAKYDNMRIAYKESILNKLVPDSRMLEEALNARWLPKFGDQYRNATFQFMFEELPEMQENLEEISKWVVPLLDRGVINKAEVRGMFNFEPSNDPDLEVHTVQMGTIPLSDAVDPISLDPAFDTVDEE